MKLYFADLKEHNFNAEDMASDRLPGWVTKKISKVNRSLRKKEIYVGYHMLLAALKDAGIKEPSEVKYGKYGKPYIDGFNYNISHSEDFIVLVCSADECGVDIMKITGFNEKVALKYFTEKEIIGIYNSENKDEAFTKIWSLKEAFFKMTGEGISRKTKEVDFSTLLSTELPFKTNFSGKGIYAEKIRDSLVFVCTENFENLNEICEVIL